MTAMALSGVTGLALLVAQSEGAPYETCCACLCMIVFVLGLIAFILDN